MLRRGASMPPPLSITGDAVRLGRARGDQVVKDQPLRPCRPQPVSSSPALCCRYSTGKRLLVSWS